MTGIRSGKEQQEFKNSLKGLTFNELMLKAKKVISNRIKAKDYQEKVDLMEDFTAIKRAMLNIADTKIKKDIVDALEDDLSYMINKKETSNIKLANVTNRIKEQSADTNFELNDAACRKIANYGHVIIKGYDFQLAAVEYRPETNNVVVKVKLLRVDSKKLNSKQGADVDFYISITSSGKTLPEAIKESFMLYLKPRVIYDLNSRES